MANRRRGWFRLFGKIVEDPDLIGAKSGYRKTSFGPVYVSPAMFTLIEAADREKDHDFLLSLHDNIAVWHLYKCRPFGAKLTPRVIVEKGL